jgi:hypothetical protein
MRGFLLDTPVLRFEQPNWRSTKTSPAIQSPWQSPAIHTASAATPAELRALFTHEDEAEIMDDFSSDCKSSYTASRISISTDQQ